MRVPYQKDLLEITMEKNYVEVAFSALYNKLHQKTNNFEVFRPAFQEALEFLHNNIEPDLSVVIKFRPLPRNLIRVFIESVTGGPNCDLFPDDLEKLREYFAVVNWNHEQVKFIEETLLGLDATAQQFFEKEIKNFHRLQKEAGYSEEKEMEYAKSN